MWEVEYTNEFGDWWDTLAVGQQEALDDRIRLLADHGPALKRPVVGAIAGSRHRNMKELRASAEGGSLRVLFAFDPRRQVILLLGGDKSGRVGQVVRVGDPSHRSPLRHLPPRTKARRTDLDRK